MSDVKGPETPEPAGATADEWTHAAPGHAALGATSADRHVPERHPRARLPRRVPSPDSVGAASRANRGHTGLHHGSGREVALPDHPPGSTLYAALKRALDIAVALAGLVLVTALAVVVALAYQLGERSPLFYSQLRVGRGGRAFRIYKFRSMIVGAERPGEAVWSRPGDPRVTRIGRALRRTHLDELPQLWNVLLGDMSLVGPRPERPEIIRELLETIPAYGARHVVRPGLTGWAQVNYPYGNTLRDALVKLEYDLYYIRNRGYRLDLLCLARTVRAVASLSGI